MLGFDKKKKKTGKLKEEIVKFIFPQTYVHMHKHKMDVYTRKNEKQCLRKLCSRAHNMNV